MFVSLRRTQTWRLHTKLYKFGWHTSANNARIKNSRDLILDEVAYISIIYRISDSWLFSLNGYDFYFDHMTVENREYLLTSTSWYQQTLQSSRNKLLLILWHNRLPYQQYDLLKTPLILALSAYNPKTNWLISFNGNACYPRIKNCCY